MPRGGYFQTRQEVVFAIDEAAKHPEGRGVRMKISRLEDVRTAGELAGINPFDSPGLSPGYAQG